jgi:hypothetical protein
MVQRRDDPSKYHVMTMRWPHDIWIHVRHYATQHRVNATHAAAHLVARGLEFERATNRYTLPVPEVGCAYARTYQSPTPCGGPVEHVVVYRGPSGREQGRTMVCHDHQTEALNRPKVTGARMLADLERLPDLDDEEAQEKPA